MSVTAPFWLSRAEVRELDRRAIEEFDLPGIVLMENAGRGAAVMMRRLNPERQRALILCGPGNNGGDGFVMARHLENYGWPVRVLLFDGQEKAANEAEYTGERLPADALRNFNIVRRTGIEIAVLQGQFQAAARNWLSDEIITQECWLVDALFGTGLNRELSRPFDEVVAMMNASHNPVLSIDIPSGLDCDTGEPLGTTVKADHTVTFVAWKKGFYRPEAEPWIGEVHVLDIGAPKKLVDHFRALRSEV
jgi:NAD(P)H-hydrate epimerase